MNCAELWKIIREYPESTELFIQVGDDLVPLTPEHISVNGSMVALGAVPFDGPIETATPAPKGRKKAK